MRWLLLTALALAVSAQALELEEIREVKTPDFAKILGYEFRVRDHVAAPDGSFYVVGAVQQGRSPQGAKNATKDLLIYPRDVHDIFLAHVSAEGDQLSISFFGGSDHDEVRFVRLGPDASIYLFGTTQSRDFPLPAPTAARGVFVVRVDPEQGRIVNAWRSSGSTDDILQAVAPAPDGGFFIAGETTSLDFPAFSGEAPSGGDFGVIATNDGGASWEEPSGGLVRRRVERILFHPADPDRVIAVHSPTVSLSDDGGRTWRLGGASPTSGFHGLAGDPKNPEVLYAGSKSAALKSEDGGESWTTVQEFAPLLIPSARAVQAAPTEPTTVYGIDMALVRRSQNAGVDWERFYSFTSPIAAFAATNTDPPRLYVGLLGGGLRSLVDTGEPAPAEWELLPLGAEINALGVDAEAPARVLAGTREGVYLSLDGGLTWSVSTDGLPQGGAVTQVAFDPHDENRFWALAASRLYRSDDLGVSWVQAASPEGLPLLGFAVDPQTPGRVLMGSHRPTDRDIFAVRLTAELDLSYARVLGGFDEEYLVRTKEDEFGRLTLAGMTESEEFLAESRIGPNGEADAFLLRLSPDGVLVDIAVRIGGSGDETVLATEETARGDWLLAGETASADFPASGAQTVLAGESDGFVVRLTPDGRELLASTLIGGARLDRVERIATLDGDRVAIAGRTESSNFPVTEYGAGCTRYGSDRRMGFLATLSADLTRIEGATRLGDSSNQGFVGGLRISGQGVLVEILGDSRQRLNDQDVVTEGPHELLFRADGTEPEVVGACVFNAASQIAGPAVAGGMLTINGRGIGPEEFVVADLREGALPFELDGVRVWFDEEPAALVHVQAYQVSVVAPASIAGRGSVGMVVERDGIRSRPFRIEVHEAHPGFFTQSLNGFEGALFNEDWSLNGYEAPAPDRSVVAGFITGGGLLEPAIDPNAIAGFGELSRLVLPVTATIDKFPAEVEFAGQAPGQPNAVQQINIRIPASIRAMTSARSLRLVVDVGGVKTQAVQILID